MQFVCLVSISLLLLLHSFRVPQLENQTRQLSVEAPENYSSSMAADSSSSSLSARSNLERFLHCITPSLPSKTLPQCCLQDLNGEWQPPDKDSLEYFTLGELWDCYEEWSAYGIGIPLQLNNGDKIMQYFVPYLSAIQIYTTKSLATSRDRKEDIEIDDYECDSWSDDTGSENLSRSLSNNSSRTWDAVSEDSTAEQEGLWAARNKLGHLGYLYLQYFEQSSPYWRMPLADKINELTRVYPLLMTLRSVDLSPASWMSVSWYPIYNIPRQKNEKDFATCFLTYHTLSSSFQDSEEDYARVDGKQSTDDGKEEEEGEEKCGGIVLPSFGLVSHKMQADVWIKPGSGDQERTYLLHSAADSWLKQLAVHHHDFNFFTTHSTVS